MAMALWRLSRPLPGHLRTHLGRQVLSRIPLETARAQLLARMPKGSACAEIGVWQGDFSREILEIVRPATLHLLDPWTFQPQFPERMYGGRIADGQAYMDRLYGSVLGRFAGHDNVRVHRLFSRDLLRAVGVGSLDWVYIDGNHSKDAVREDLHLAWQAVRPGGFITGDDYFWIDADGSFTVQAAVDEFARERGVEVELVGGQFVLLRA